ncbi:acetyltransferase [Kineosporia mesophila]|uniref:Acetyltransferase n=1 Tax=Kineosporia mesophila TaxID=566012 RepID=A0ABP6Z3K6_9ACTN|nr:acetyltransferase [Kineosporia mesophila]MCD5350985.1 acetyltransferase [Kineosporia mesophila]
MSTQDVVLLGSGGLGRETVQITRSPGSRARVIGFLDDDPRLRDRTVAGLPVLGPTGDAAGLGGDVAVVATVASAADPQRRSRLVGRLGLPSGRYTRIVHPAASLAPDTELGVGTVVMAGVIATSDVRVGRHVVLMPGCVLTHDVKVGDGATLAAGVLLAGGVIVEPDAYLGSGVRVREGVRIGAGAVIGMGSVVLHDIPAAQVWVGVPARPLER